MRVEYSCRNKEAKTFHPLNNGPQLYLYVEETPFSLKGMKTYRKPCIIIPPVFGGFPTFRTNYFPSLPVLRCSLFSRLLVTALPCPGRALAGIHSFWIIHPESLVRLED
jgi:hypothetical protein